jgi:hypothetical protein
VQKKVALAQALQVLQAVAAVAAALAQVVTCEKTFLSRLLRSELGAGTFGCDRKWDGMKCGDQYAFVGLASGLPRPHCCYACSRLDVEI